MTDWIIVYCKQLCNMPPNFLVSFFFLSVFYKQIDRRFFAKVSSFVTHERCDQGWAYFIGRSGNFFVIVLFIMKFHVRKHARPYALDINLNNRGARETCSSIIKNIISPLSYPFVHETLHGGDSPRGTLTQKVVWPFDHVVLRDHETNFKNCVSITTMAMVPKLDRMTIYLQGSPPLFDQLNILYPNYHNNYGHRVWWYTMKKLNRWKKLVPK